MAYTETDLINDFITKEIHVTEARRSPAIVKIATQNNLMVEKMQEISSNWSIKRKLQSELIAMTNSLSIGSINKTPEALKNAKVGVARAKRAIDIIDYAEKYETYEAVIKSMNDKQFDAKGLPKDPVRVFIASQKAILRNNISSELCSDSERSLFKARIKNLDALEKEYKSIQQLHMEKYIKRNPEHPNTELYLVKNNIRVNKDPSIER